MAPKAGARRAQVTLRGLGKHFESPKHPRDKRQTQHIVEIPGKGLKRRCLVERLEELQRKTISDVVQEDDDALSDDTLDVEIDFMVDLDPGDKDYLPSDVEPEIIKDTHEQTHQDAHDLSHRMYMPVFYFLQNTQPRCRERRSRNLSDTVWDLLFSGMTYSR